MPNDDGTSPPPLDTAPEDWESPIRTQAVLLETILTQLETTSRTLHQSKARQPRLATLLAQTQAFLHNQAQTPVMLERQLA